MSRSAASALFAALAVGLAGLATHATTRSPVPVPGDAAPDGFSAARAAAHLDVIARAPHPIGTPEHDAVRDYLVGALADLDLEPEVQTTTAVRANRYGMSVAADVANVTVRLDGREEGDALLLLAHYDSAPGSNGAGDDGAAVAAMLETLRILAAGPQLRNDVIALFSDAEEVGLVGAAAFLERHRWAGDVGLVANFEARGTGGPVLMFETSAGGGALIGELADAVPDPIASSLSDAVYRQMPNDSDFTLFRARGVPGFNFAFMHGGTAYHTAQDSVERLSLRTLQHQGETMLGLARHFGGVDLDAGWPTGDAIYFNPLGSVLVVYPAAAALPLAVVLLLASAGAAALGFGRGRLTARGFAVGLVAIPLGAGLLGFALRFVAGGLTDQDYNFVVLGDWTSQSLALLGLALIGAGISIAALRFLEARAGADNLIGAGLLVWAALGMAAAVVLPGGSYLFAVPLLLMLPAAFAWLGERPAATVRASLVAALAIGVAGAALLWPPVIALVGVALGAQVAPLVAGASVWLLLVGLLGAPLSLTPSRGRRFAAAAAAGAGAAVLGLVAALSSHGPDNRAPNTILYALDTETGEAAWLSYDDAPDEWTEQFLGESPRWTSAPGFLRGFPMLTAPAPTVALDGADVETLRATPVAGGHRVEARIRWPYRTHRALVFMRSEARIREASVAGHEIGAGEAGASFIYDAPPRDGIDVEVELADGAPLEIEAVAQIHALPKLPGFAYSPRPDGMMAALSAGRGVDSTFVRSVDVVAPHAALALGGPR